MLCSLLWIVTLFSQAQPPSPSVSDYDVIWSSPSSDASGSMPLGNGDVATNLWVEPSGEIVFYIARSDAWDENARLVKLGRVRLTLSPNPFSTRFEQRLNLRDGMIELNGDGHTSMRVWVDAHHPVIQIEANTAQPTELVASLEPWRTQQRQLTAGGGHGDMGELSAAWGMYGSPEPAIAHPDTVVPDQADRLTWYHRNPTSIWPLTMKHQGLEPLMKDLRDPLLHRTFGGVIAGNAMSRAGDTSLRSAAPSTQHRLRIVLHTQQTETPEQWLAQLGQVLESIPQDLDARREAHRDWWHQFWDRSWIYIRGDESAEIVSRGYALQRFIGACAGRGAYPIKFNGSLFTVEARDGDRQFDPDYRRWGGPYWFQNTRLPYWPMLAAGDFDTMQPFFRMYLDAIPLARGRSKLYFNHDGAYFPETMEFWGTWANRDYGWDRTGKHISEVESPWIRWYWSGGLELIMIALDRYEFTQEQQFLRETVLPLAEAVLTFFDQHYPRDENGKLHFHPAQALETWQDATNPAPEIAGIISVTKRLLAMPEPLTTPQLRDLCQRLQGELPPLPIDEQQNLLLPAHRYDQLRNIENPELYALFPYRIFGLHRPQLELAINTFQHRRHKQDIGWQQHGVQAAMLGLTDEAKQSVVGRFATKHEGSRFPAFWGPNYDWVPDQDHGSVAMMTLQTMLIQWNDEKIFLLPAWPKEWDVSFKLHAPRNTTIRGVYRNGRLQSLEVSPPERKDQVHF